MSAKVIHPHEGPAKRAREVEMLYLVESRASIDQGNAIDAGEGSGAVFAKIADSRGFKPG